MASADAEASWTLWFGSIKDIPISNMNPEEWLHRAFVTGFTAGRMVGNHEGRSSGYDEGYRDGQDDGSNSRYDGR